MFCLRQRARGSTCVCLFVSLILYFIISLSLFVHVICLAMYLSVRFMSGAVE